MVSARSRITQESITGSDSRIVRHRSTITDQVSRDSNVRSLLETERTGHRSTSQISITGDNNIYVAGDYTVVGGSRPYIPRTINRGTYYHIRKSNHWYNHGNFYSWNWSPYSCGRVAYIPYRSYFGLSYYYPSYHRKYLFVSIGGYWPHHYRYRRYYWYGCHPHRWYGDHVIERPVVENTYNTYNYYGTTQEQVDYNYDYSNVYSSEYDDFSDVRERISRQKAMQEAQDTPELENAADICFNHGVESFNQGNYDDAVIQFREAVLFNPDDMILPYTYCQALFASGDYSRAASVLRHAISMMADDELTVYFPRGLYPDEEILMAQIEALEAAMINEPFSSDLQLLAGYQLIGTEELERATAHLLEATKDPESEEYAAILLELVAKLEEEQQEELNQ